MRVLHVINGEQYSGIERVLDYLASEMLDLGFEIEFACLKPGRFAAAIALKDVAVYEIPMRHKMDLSASWRLGRLVRERRYRILHTHTVRGALVVYPVVKRLKPRWIHQLHSPALRESTNAVSNMVNGLVERVTLPAADAIVAVSGSLQDCALEQGLATERVAVVYNGVPAAPAYIRVKRSSNEFTIGMVALFRPRKGLEVLLSAVSMLKGRGLLAQLHLIGEFESEAYLSQVQRRADELSILDRIDFRGFSETVYDELKHLNVFVLPSLFGEGLPMALLEAMSVGLPIVATRTGGIPEVIRSGIEGLLVPPGDTRELCDALSNIKVNHSAGILLGQRAQIRQARDFTVEAMAAGMATRYQELLARYMPLSDYRGSHSGKSSKPSAL